MLMPALSKAREKAESIACVNNVKQLDTAIIMYLDNNKNTFLSSNKIWLHAAYENIGEEKTFSCPAKEQTIDDNHKILYYSVTYYINGTRGDGKDHCQIYPTYGFNQVLQFNNYRTTLKTNSIRKPSQSLMLGCCDAWLGGSDKIDSGIDSLGYIKNYCKAGMGESIDGVYSEVNLHGHSRNIGYIDGHVESVEWGNIKVRYARTNDDTTNPIWSEKLGGSMRYSYKDLTED